MHEGPDKKCRFGASGHLHTKAVSGKRCLNMGKLCISSEYNPVLNSCVLSEISILCAGVSFVFID